MTKKIHKYSNKKLSRGEPPNFSGQHLMHNKKLLHEIVAQANISMNDTVLELGAGKGALTTILTKKAGKVLAVEYDARFIDILREKTVQNHNTKIIHQDIMKIHLPKENFIVVSNIPYSITTPIMKMLLSNPANRFQRGVIIMEKGAAKRFTSKTIKDPYILVWRMWFDIYYVKGIAKEHFSPPPKVESAMIKIVRRKEPFIPNKDYFAFLGLIEYAFRNASAPINAALRGIFSSPQLKQLRRSLKISIETPIGTLNERQWAIVFKTMLQYVPHPYWPKLPNKKRKRF
ncbi:23S ribosomal RNA methyltransferase Erm [Bacillus sp. Bva_UNVM-123]|uniref:23S ribosomal RNA methyltransferase Erm n=1 Tax=Bacillus sp. Bva_UNVM-123 TaxID=2829798 RepID=UPI00391EFEAC